MKKYISIIVPIYNSEHTLDRCLTSIINQTYKELEIILINDGSNDNSLSICEEYKKIDSRIRILSQDNCGLIAARKRGVECATSDIIGFVDSDDWIEPDMYYNMVQKIYKYNCDIVSSGIYRDYQSGEETVEVYDNFIEGLYMDLKTEIYPTMLWNEKKHDYGLYCTLVNKLFKKNILIDVYKQIDQRVFFGEDCLTLYSYILRAESLYIMEKAFYHYMIHEGSMCRSSDEKLLMNTYYLYNGLRNIFMCEKDNYYILMRQLQRYMLEVESHLLYRVFNINIYSFDDWGFGYNQQIFGKRVVIYGAGMCGQALYRYINKNITGATIVAWIDKNPKGKNELCLYDISPREVLNNLDFDFVIIGISSKNIAKNIQSELIELYNIEKSKILWQSTKRIPFWDKI